MARAGDEVMCLSEAVGLDTMNCSVVAGLGLHTSSEEGQNSSSQVVRPLPSAYVHIHNYVCTLWVLDPEFQLIYCTVTSSRAGPASSL